MKRFVGAIILLLVIAGLVAWQLVRSQQEKSIAARGPDVTLTGKIGGEKKGFLSDPDVQRILKDRYGLTVDFKVAGSLEMVSDPTTGLDFLWPASQVVVEYFQERGGRYEKAENIFHSPIVLYSWQSVADALIPAGIVEQRGESYFAVDFPRLIKAVVEGQQWSDLGLPQLHGRIAVISTDPTRSNSGNAFAGLLANTLNGGEVATADTIDLLLPEIRRFFDRLGFLDHSSGKLFAAYLTQGVGAHPMIVGYENQLVEFSLEHPEALEKLRREVRILYPEPTTWSSHPLIALNDQGKRLVHALTDDEIQRLAWEKHGFRSGLLGVENDPSVLKVVGLPATIESVQQIPSARVMTRIVDELSSR